MTQKNGARCLNTPEEMRPADRKLYCPAIPQGTFAFVSERAREDGKRQMQWDDLKIGRALFDGSINFEAALEVVKPEVESRPKFI